MSQEDYNLEEETLEEEEQEVSEEESNDSQEEEDNSDSEESLEAESDDSDELKAWKARALRAEEKFTKSKKALQAQKTEKKLKARPEEVDEDVSDRIARLEQSEEKRTFGFSHGLSPSQTDEIFAYAKGKGVDPATALKTATGKAILNTVKRKERVANNSPSSTPASNYSSKKFHELSPQEKNKAHQDYIKRKFGGK